MTTRRSSQPQLQSSAAPPTPASALFGNGPVVLRGGSGGGSSNTSAGAGSENRTGGTDGTSSQQQAHLQLDLANVSNREPVADNHVFTSTPRRASGAFVAGGTPTKLRTAGAAASTATPTAAAAASAPMAARRLATPATIQPVANTPEDQRKRIAELELELLQAKVEVMRARDELKNADMRAERIAEEKVRKLRQQESMRAAGRLGTIWLAKTRVSQLENTVKGLHERIEALVSAAEERELYWTRQQSGWQEEVEALKDRVGQLQDELARGEGIQNELQRLREAFRSSEDSRTQLQAALDSAQLVIEELKAQLATQEEDKKSCLAELEKMQQAMDERENAFKAEKASAVASAVKRERETVLQLAKQEREAAIRAERARHHEEAIALREEIIARREELISQKEATNELQAALSVETARREQLEAENRRLRLRLSETAKFLSQQANVASYVSNDGISLAQNLNTPRLTPKGGVLRGTPPVSAASSGSFSATDASPVETSDFTLRGKAPSSLNVSDAGSTSEIGAPTSNSFASVARLATLISSSATALLDRSRQGAPGTVSATTTPTSAQSKQSEQPSEVPKVTQDAKEQVSCDLAKPSGASTEVDKESASSAAPTSQAPSISDTDSSAHSQDSNTVSVTAPTNANCVSAVDPDEEEDEDIALSKMLCDTLPELFGSMTKVISESTTRIDVLERTLHQQSQVTELYAKDIELDVATPEELQRLEAEEDGDTGFCVEDQPGDSISNQLPEMPEPHVEEFEAQAAQELKQATEAADTNPAVPQPPRVALDGHTSKEEMLAKLQQLHRENQLRHESQLDDAHRELLRRQQQFRAPGTNNNEFVVWRPAPTPARNMQRRKSGQAQSLVINLDSLQSPFGHNPGVNIHGLVDGDDADDRGM